MNVTKQLQPGQKYEVMAEIMRVTKGVATVIVVDGNRYVLDMGQNRGANKR